MEIGIGIVSVCQLFGPKRILEHLVDEQTAAAHAVELIDKIDKFLVGKIEVVEIDIQAGTIVGTNFSRAYWQRKVVLPTASAALIPMSRCDQSISCISPLLTGEFTCSTRYLWVLKKVSISIACNSGQI